MHGTTNLKFWSDSTHLCN